MVQENTLYSRCYQDAQSTFACIFQLTKWILSSLAKTNTTKTTTETPNPLRNFRQHRLDHQSPAVISELVQRQNTLLQ